MNVDKPNPHDNLVSLLERMVFVLRLFTALPPWNNKAGVNSLEIITFINLCWSFTLIFVKICLVYPNCIQNKNVTNAPPTTFQGLQAQAQYKWNSTQYSPSVVEEGFKDYCRLFPA